MIDLTGSKAGGVAGEANPAPASDDPYPVLTHQHDFMQAQYDKLQRSRTTLDRVKTELDSLSGMGDALDQEAVIKSAGKLVSHGLGASAMAALLADMPDGGDALHIWVAGHSEVLAKQEAEIDPKLAEIRHHLGLSGLRLVAAHLHPDAPKMLAGGKLSPVSRPNPATPNLGAPDAA